MAAFGGATYVSVVNQLEFNTHASNIGSTHVCSIHETDAVHGTDHKNQSYIDSANNLLLLLFSEAMVALGIATLANLAPKLVVRLGSKVLVIDHLLLRVLWPRRHDENSQQQKLELTLLFFLEW
jgi:hypothetical protein